jgi:hypothetical protein
MHHRQEKKGRISAKFIFPLLLVGTIQKQVVGRVMRISPNPFVCYNYPIVLHMD